MQLSNRNGGSTTAVAAAVSFCVLNACSSPAGPTTQRSADQNGPAPGLPVLMYHDIITADYVAQVRGGTTYSSDVWLQDFQAQMTWLASSGYTPISADDAVAYVSGQAVVGDGRIPQRPVLLTFDDSFDSQYAVWKSELVPRGFKATFFVISGYAAGQVTASGRHMSQDEVAEMAQSPLVQIESHTVNHPDLATLSHDALVSELQNSKQALAPYGASYLAYPFGSHTIDTLTEAKNWYAAGFCVGSSKARYGDDPFCIPRLGVGIWTQGDLGKFAAIFGGNVTPVSDPTPAPTCAAQGTALGSLVCNYAGLAAAATTLASCVASAGGAACFTDASTGPLCGDGSNGGYTCNLDTLSECLCFGGGGGCVTQACVQCANPGCD